MTSTAVASYQPVPMEPAPRLGSDGADAPPVFAAEGQGVDGLGRAATAALLAEVVLHRRVETPLALGIFGPAGSGKSRFIAAILDSAEQLAAGTGTGASPFLSRIVIARVAAVPGRDAAALLVGGVIEALADDHAALAEDAIHAGGDPREAARLSGERSNALRRALDGERQALDDLSARRARLTDTVLFDGAGSRVDAFARANRVRIESRLRTFGFTAADPIRTYKELVRTGAETDGGGSRLGLMLRSLWRFKGQGTLIVLAVLLGTLGWAAGVGADNPDAVSTWLGGFGDRFSAMADGSRAHLDLLQPIGRIALALAALALLADIVRAGRFLGPILRGITLLKGDLAARRRDLDSLLAHQTRRVDGVAAEADAAGRGAEAARRRLEGRRGTGLSDHGAALATEIFGLSRTPEAAAAGFFARLSEGAEGAPERILVALDGLGRLPAPEAVAFLETTHRLVGRPGFALVVALEREQAAAALGEFDPAGAAARLDRILQLTYDLGAETVDPALLAGCLLDPRMVGGTAVAPVDASRSALDAGLQSFEVDLVRRLAPFAGGTPRRVKRFVNAYRVARADPRVTRAAPATLGMLALGLALDGTAAGGDLMGFDADVSRGKVTVDQNSDFGRAFAAALSDIGPDASPRDMLRGLAVARSYGRRG